MSVPKPLRMTADEFIAWALEQPHGRYELAGGEVIAMAPERAGHALAKLAIARALGDAVAAAGLDCQVFPDGMAIRIDEGTVYEPDASVRCGPRLPQDAIELPDPQIVVEMLSPSSRAQDSGAQRMGSASRPARASSSTSWRVSRPYMRTMICVSFSSVRTVRSKRARSMTSGSR